MIRALSWLAVLQRRIAVKLAWWIRRETPRSGPLGLKRILIAEGRTRWLDIGNGDRFEDGFEYLDWMVPGDIDPAIRKRCHQADILNLTESDAAALGTFDLVRMQHVFEHFSFEEGPRVLQSCRSLLKPCGILLMTVPDLQMFVDAYRGCAFGLFKSFRSFALGRIPACAPPSAYFSMFAHSFGYSPDLGLVAARMHRDQHKWCYDFQGLAYQLGRAGGFAAIRRIGLLHSLASISFTHNRLEQDLCVLSVKAGVCQ